MHGWSSSNSSHELCNLIGTGASPLLIDMRREAACVPYATMTVSAVRRRPERVQGWLAILRGLSSNFPDDHQMLRYGLIVYHALYTWCRSEVPQWCTATAGCRDELFQEAMRAAGERNCES